MNRTLIISSIVLTATGYFTFFVPMEGQSIASHAGDIWRSATMQQKLRLVQEGVPRVLVRAVPDKVRDYFGQSPAPSKPPREARPAPPPERRQRRSSEDHTERDRRSLQALVNQVHKSR